MITLTWHAQNLNRLWLRNNNDIFSEKLALTISDDVTLITLSAQIHSEKSFGHHLSLCQVWCSHCFWFGSSIVAAKILRISYVTIPDVIFWCNYAFLYIAFTSLFQTRIHQDLEIVLSLRNGPKHEYFLRLVRAGVSKFRPASNFHAARTSCCTMAP